MNEMNFDWDDLRLFLAVARDGGLAAAAAATGKSAPTLGRRMLALERRLGRELFHRLPRGYRLTPSGEALLTEATALEHLIFPMVAAEQAQPLVKLSAGTWVTYSLCARVPDLIGAGGIRLRFIAADEKVDIGRRAAVIGVRNRRPDGPGLAGRRIGPVRFAVYGRDREVKTWARPTGTTPSALWVQDVSRGGAAIEVTSPRSALDLALAGQARVVLPTFIGEGQAGLEMLSGPIEALNHDQWLVTHHEDRFEPAVRGVLDRIYAVLRQVTAGPGAPSGPSGVPAARYLS